MIDYKNLTDEELLELFDKSDNFITKELSDLKNSDPDFKMRLINLAKNEINYLKSSYIEHLEKVISDDRVPENIKAELELKLIKYKSWQKNQ